MLIDHIANLITEYEAEIKNNNKQIEDTKAAIKNHEEAIILLEQKIMSIHHQNRDIINVVAHLEASIKKQQEVANKKD